ncbi:hypothetical protein LTR20_009326 [Exophiala xenobiotica]|nr:hypothetical protein LTR20_009326 [Exophiala xenobiotica]KAK5472287.1 hypothetical protein LTR26_010413 [Exophiala xenobiotica]KAK5480887.1 hypothetical protein LTR83_009959 [Exophiala xenobiotica]
MTVEAGPTTTTSSSSSSSSSTTTSSYEDDQEEPVIAGPYSLFDGSFILEFLKPRPSRNASVLMRATYKHDHPLCKRGKSHAQSPPLHIHFQQSETFSVVRGSIGTTTTYSAIDTIHTHPDTTTTGAATKPHEIAPWVPHSFWPDPNASQDTTILVRAHPNPDDMDEKMDRLFFQNLLMYVSDVAEGKEKLSVLQVMLTQRQPGVVNRHVSATALVWFPRAWFLGPLRWWIPYQFQALCALMARCAGMKPLIEKYMSEQEWEEVQERMNNGGGGKVKRAKTA